MLFETPMRVQLLNFHEVSETYLRATPTLSSNLWVILRCAAEVHVVVIVTEMLYDCTIDVLTKI